jgi:hypothetical protein
MHSIPEPVSMPAAVGAIQWIEGFQAVHANLFTMLVTENMYACDDVAYQNNPVVKIGAPMMGYSRRHSGMGTSLLAFNFLAYDPL